MGQCSGMTDSLNLESAQIVLKMLKVPEEERPDVTQRLITLHSIVMERLHKKAKK